MSKIFISIACFMDNDIANTLKDCLNKSKYPNNIVFGICLQSEDDDKCLDKYKDNKQFKIKHINWSKARGPAYARGIIYDMFSDEDYFFQIDCHTRFYQDWDEKIIKCFNDCKKINNKAVISHYPVNINHMGKNDHSIVNISTVRCIDINMGIKTHGRFVNTSSCPMKSWGLSAAMLFFDQKAYHDIPFDKDIYFGLQFEEQVVLAARYWTHGYDIFTPNEHIIATEYITNRKRQKRSVPCIPNLQKETYDRLCHIMKLKYNSKYNDIQNSRLGNVRSIEDYYKMLGIYDKVLEVYPENYLDIKPDQYYKSLTNKNSPKILILILSSGGIYEKTNDLSRLTWLNNIKDFPNIEYKFYYGNSKTEFKSDEIHINCVDKRYNILLKTIKCFELIDKDHDYDFMLRLCACSYIDLYKLNKFVSKLDKKKIVSGPLNVTSNGADVRYNLKKEKFIVGANMLLSKDVIKDIITNKNELNYKKYGHADDLCLSIYIKEHIVPENKWITQRWIGLDNNNHVENLQKATSYHFHYDHRKYSDKLCEFHKNYKG